MDDFDYDAMIAHHENQIEKIKELDFYETETDRLLAIEYHEKLLEHVKWLKDYKPEE